MTKNLIGPWPHLTHDEREYILRYVNYYRKNHRMPVVTMATLPFLSLHDTKTALAFDFLPKNKAIAKKLKAHRREAK